VVLNFKAAKRERATELLNFTVIASLSLSLFLHQSTMVKRDQIGQADPNQ
jgi:hypothetical protein